MPSLMDARWVGQNDGPIFRRLLTKVRRIRSACARVSVVCNAVFRLTMSRCIPEILAIKSRSCPNRAEILMFLGRQISGGGAPKFLTEFYKSGWLSNEHVAKFGDDRPSDLGDYSTKKKRKKKEVRRSKL